MGKKIVETDWMSLSLEPVLIIGIYRNVALGREHPLSPTIGELVRLPDKQSLLLLGLSDIDVAQKFTLFACVGVQSGAGVSGARSAYAHRSAARHDGGRGAPQRRAARSVSPTPGRRPMRRRAPPVKTAYRLCKPNSRKPTVILT